jgi:hypothetical protein
MVPHGYRHNLWLLRPSQSSVRNGRAIKFASSTEAPAGEAELVLSATDTENSFHHRRDVHSQRNGSAFARFHLFGAATAGRFVDKKFPG